MANLPPLPELPPSVVPGTPAVTYALPSGGSVTAPAWQAPRNLATPALSSSAPSGSSGGTGSSFLSRLLGGPSMASATVDFSSLFKTVGDTVSSIYRGESEAEIARARIKADASRDAAAILAGQRYQGSSSGGVSLGNLSGIVPYVGLALVGTMLLKAFGK